jgi:hypothetical protein
MEELDEEYQFLEAEGYFDNLMRMEIEEKGRRRDKKREKEEVSKDDFNLGR